MKLQTMLVDKLDIAEDIEINGIQNDSRLVKPGDLFLAYPGHQSDGRLFIAEALKKGARAVVYEASHLPPSLVLPSNCYPLMDLYRFMPVLIDRFYHNPADNLSIIGITGTNGKTTIAYQLAQAYELLGMATAYIGTIGQGKPDSLQSLGNTTPDTLHLKKLMQNYVRSGCSRVCMEVSSHALDQGRVAGLKFKQAIFTNISLDHLDYHQTMEHYAGAKAKLFSSEGLGWAIINFDDEYAAVMKQALRPNTKLMTYGFKKGSDVQAIKWQISLEGSEIEVLTPQGSQELVIKSVGLFNVYNALAIFASLLAEGYNKEHIAKIISRLKAAPGRMEQVSTEPVTLVDYAHTPDALENVLVTLTALKKGRLILVFGCGGDRDRSKRPIMGSIAEQYADIIIITSDNPRTEPIDAIISDIKRGISGNKEVLIEGDRAQAIAKAIELADARDIIVVAGKGHEYYQEIDHVKHPFSDVDVIRKKLMTL